MHIGGHQGFYVLHVSPGGTCHSRVAKLGMCFELTLGLESTFTQCVWLHAIQIGQIWPFESSAIGTRTESFDGAILVFDIGCQLMGTFVGLQFSWPAPSTPTELDFGSAWGQGAPPLVFGGLKTRVLDVRKKALSEA